MNYRTRDVIVDVWRFDERPEPEWLDDKICRDDNGTAVLIQGKKQRRIVPGVFCVWYPGGTIGTYGAREFPYMGAKVGSRD
jgi:hypothetical protein